MQVAQNISSQLGGLGSSYSSGVQAGQQQLLNQGQLAIQQVQIDSAKNQEKYDRITQTLKLLEPGAISAAKNGGQKGLDEYKNKVAQNPQVAAMFKGIGLDPNDISFQVADGEIKSTGIRSQKVFDKPTILDVNGTKTTLQPGAYIVDTEITNGVPKIAGITQDTEYTKKQQDLRKGAAEIGKISAETNYYNAQSNQKNSTPIGKTLPAATTTKISEINNGLNELDKGIDFLKNPRIKDIVGPIAGRTLGQNPKNPLAKNFQQYLATTKQLIGKGLEGGVLRKEDEKKYEEILPKITDDYQVIIDKSNRLRQTLVDKYNNDLQSYDEAGYNVSKFKPLTNKKIDLSPISSKSIQKGTIIEKGGKRYTYNGVGDPNSASNWTPL